MSLLDGASRPEHDPLVRSHVITMPSNRSLLLYTSISLLPLALLRYRVNKFNANNNDVLSEEKRRRLLEQPLVGIDGFPLQWTPVNCTAYTSFDDPELDPNGGELFARWTAVDPPFWMSLHNRLYDPMRLVVYDKGEYYEKALTNTFHRILVNSPANARVLDVGGNIGWFTMKSASLGHHVDVFEPNPKNILRMCQSCWLNQWGTASEDEINNRQTKKGSVNIRPYGVGNSSTSLPMYFGKNPGKASFLRQMLPKKNIPVKATDGIQMVTLDSMATELGWFEGDVKIAIMKVDVEGFEPFVMQGASKLLKSNLVENVLMEITGMGPEENHVNFAMIQLLVDSDFVLYMTGGPAGPTSRKDVPPTDDALVEKLIGSCAHKRGLQCNLWWIKRALFVEDGN